MNSLFQQFKRNRDERPDAPAFLIAAGDRSVPISWRRFTDDVEAIAQLLHRDGRGGVIGLLGENSYEFMTAHAAGLFSPGVTVLPLDVGLSASEIAERLRFTGARALVHSALYREKAREVENLVPDLIVAGFGSARADEYMAVARAELDAGEPGLFDRPPRDENEVATLIFTSGTTTHPRGAELTLAGFGAFADFAARQLPIRPGTRSLMLLPLHHVYGVCVTYLMLARGAALGVCPDFRRLTDAVARFRANCLYLVPALAEIFATKVVQRGGMRESLGFPVDWVLSGGAPLPRRTYDRLTGLGARVLQIYGLTETCALYAMSPYADPRPGSVGVACGGVAGMETRVSEKGHLLIRGPAVLKGYYREPERTAQSLSSDGWFDTGDLGRIDADGYVWLTGRASRTIVLSSGKKVAPEEIEEKLLALPGVAEAVVDGDGATRELRAEIYAKVSEESVRRAVDLLNRELPVHQRVRTIRFRAAPFPRTASGKIRVGARSADESALRPPYRTACAVWIFAIITGFVLLANVLPFACRHLGVVPPAGVKEFLYSCEEVAEPLLALLTLPIVFFLHRIVKARRKSTAQEGK